MRPLALEMQGFSAFQEPTSIDFRDHDLVAFTGPTGAGKSSIIDGMVFALYGSVARYGNENLVAPIINALSTEARVRFDFSVGGAEYTAVRIVRRTASGASTKEARLERGGEVLASTAQELTAEVESVLGLSFSQFTKTVVLPQGDFARFLTEKAGSRQKLLRRLLGLDVFASVGSAARRHARVLAAEKIAFEAALVDGAPISPREVEALSAQVSTLDQAVTDMASAVDDRAAGEGELNATSDELSQLNRYIESLDGLSIPPEAKTFVARLKKAEAAVISSKKRAATAKTRLAAATEKRGHLAPDDELDTLINTHLEIDDVRQSLEAHRRSYEDASIALGASVGKAEAARTALGAANETVEEARVQAGARGIAAHLEVGDSCPVCEQVVDHVPTHSGHDDDAVTNAESSREAAEASAAGAIDAVQIATAAHADASAKMAATEERYAELTAALEGQKTHRQAVAARAKAESLNAKVEIAAAAVEVALAVDDDTNTALEDATTDAALLRRQFTEARDDVGPLSPPKPSEELLSDDWRELIDWSKTQRSALIATRREVLKQEKELSKRVAALEKSILKLCTPFMAPGRTATVSESPKVLGNAHADARVALANAEDRLRRQEAIREQLSDVERDRKLTEDLGKLLISGNFERWIMTDVMHDLAERASVRLNELSAGSFSITTDGTDFQIRDHRNADELRNARTLSGGETFLTSLSLSLALAESITELASATTPPLESMFLDEGFGTLDPETLDTVAAAIEELGASGRMIGVVTHIRELADRLPTRFDVQRGAKGSSITEVGTA